MRASGMVASLLFVEPTAVDRATYSLARALGYEDATDPRFIAGGCGLSTAEEYRLSEEDRSLLRDMENDRALRSYDAMAERGE